MSGFVIPAMVKRVNFVNLVPDGSFEDVANNWNVWLAEPTDTSQAKDGARSLRLGGDALAATKTAVVPINGHKYYGREYIKTAGQLDAADCRFEMVGAVNGVEKAFVFCWNRGNYPNWTVNSGIVTIDGSYTDGFGIRTFTVSGTVSAWVDSIVVIDLTEACGAGNEPSKEWCDANIPFFNGSYEMRVPVTSPVQALVAGLTIPEGVVTQIADASGRVLWSALKLVIGSLYLRPSADIFVEHFLYPGNSDVPAYQRINEEVSDGDALCIGSNNMNGITSPTSKFKLSNTTQFGGKLLAVTGVSIMGDPYCSATSSTDKAKNEFKLEINGIETESILVETSKDVDISVQVPAVINLINEYIAIHGVLPDINISIKSYVVTGDKGSFDSGVSQIYVVLNYEGY